MLPLFEKLEAVTIEVTSLLNDSDKAICESLLEKYFSHIHFWYPRLLAFKAAHEAYKEKTETSTEDFHYSIYYDYKILDEWVKIVNDITATFIRLIENHFTQTYRLKFSSYEPTTDKDLTEPLTSYEPIITGMIAQVGADLLHSGKEQIKKNFQELFIWDRHQPELKGKKIILPSFCSLDVSYRSDAYLSRSEESMNKLLHAVALFLHDTTTITTEMQDEYDRWQNCLTFENSYQLAGFAVRFFRNGRIDLSFEDATTAKRFFETHQLLTIVAKNKLND